MCGIIGYIGQRQAQEVLLQGLTKLEYRGYDSAGLAVGSNGSPIQILKDVGKVEHLTSKLETNKIKGSMGIAHTRWATHGGVTKENAHPHTSCKKNIAVVHNGIIENYSELRKKLIEQGHTFTSETDTEVIPHLIEQEMKNGVNFTNAVMEAVKELEGTYAIVAMHAAEKKLVGARRSAPLLVGVGDGEYFIASDIPSFLEYTKNVIYLYDGDVIELDSGIKIFNGGVEVRRPIDAISWDIEQVKKGNFEHFMMKEISEQADVIKNAIKQDDREIEKIVTEINNAKGVFLVACGTAAHACTSASYFFSKVARKHINVVIGSEFPSYSHFLTPETLVIAVSQSGETADVIESIKVAKEMGSKVIAIVNVMGSTIMREADQCLLLNAGPEIGVASTKAYTAMLTVLYLLAYASTNKLEDGKRELGNLYNLVYNLTSADMRSHIRQLAEKLKDHEHLFLIGRGLQFPTAKEAAHKIKEISYIHAEGFAGGELKHCELALIDKGTPAIVFVAPDNEKEIMNNAAEIKARGGYIIGVSSRKNELFDFFIKTPECGDLNPIVQIVPMQILAYRLAVLRGNDPDKPRNLAKSVTVR